MFMYFQDAPIAQPDRVPDFESVGRGFEPLWAHHYLFFAVGFEPVRETLKLA